MPLRDRSTDLRAALEAVIDAAKRARPPRGSAVAMTPRMEQLLTTAITSAHHPETALDIAIHDYRTASGEDA